MQIYVQDPHTSQELCSFDDTRTHVGGRLRSAALHNTLSLVWRREGKHNRQCLPSKPTGWWRMRVPGCTPRGRRSPGPGERTQADNQSRVRKARKSNDLLKTCGPRPELVVGGPHVPHSGPCGSHSSPGPITPLSGEDFAHPHSTDELS